MSTPIRALARDELILAAARLAGSNNELWRQFVAAMDDCLSVSAAELIQSGGPEIYNKQGRTQALHELVNTLHSCRENAEKIIATRQRQNASVQAQKATAQS